MDSLWSGLGDSASEEEVDEKEVERKRQEDISNAQIRDKRRMNMMVMRLSSFNETQL